MKKAIFIFLGLLLALSMFSFPADTINAQPTTTPQLSPSSPAAMQVGEKELIDDILRELDQARKLTNDKDIQNQMGVIKEWVKKVQTLAERGETKAALEIKYTIARRLEWLINQLPTATPGTTTAIAAMPASNPLYDELVRIRAKIDKLIDIEEREIPTEKPPPPPEIQRPPEMEKLIVYSAKFLCGPAFGGEGVQPGSYSTAINVHNPNNDTVYLFKKAVIAQREDEPRGRISSFRKVMLNPDEAIEIDCIDIVRFFGAQQETGVGLTAPSQQAQTLLQTTAVRPLTSAVSFIKGFVVIYATAPLDVVAVYTASTPVGFSLDIEQIPRSTMGVPVHVPEEEVCPRGCYCMTKDEALGKLGPNATLCQDQPCDKDASGVLRYCWKPGEEVKCPEGCDCMTEARAKEGGYTTRCQADPCGRDQYQNLMYCFQKPAEQVTCPQGCECLALAAVPAGQKGYVLCQGKEIPCGPKPSYCYQKAECPQGCQCVSEVKAKELGLTICQNQYIFCGFDEQKVSKYCYQKPSEQAECPSPCVCLTRDDAYSRGYTSLCQEQPCGYVAGATGAVQTAKYCWKPTEQIQCPQGCYCLTKEEAGKRGYTALCQEKSCGTDTSGVLMYCWKPAEQVQCPQGCFCVTEAEANKYGYTWCQNQKIPCGKDTAGALLYCFQKPPEQVQCPQGCVCTTIDDARKYGYVYCQNQQIRCGTYRYCFQRAATTEVKPTPGRILIDPAQDRNPVGTQHTITVIVYDTNNKPMANARVKISHTGANPFSPIELTTDGNGKCNYYYTGKNAGTDTIVATVDNLSAKATKEWYSVVKPAKIDLSPSMGRNAPGTSHTVTATVWGTDGKPMPGIVVTFTVSGTNTASGSRTTDGYGRASFSYSSKLTGKDTITATAGGLTATATKYWERLQ